jgi:hypothetical protein
VVELFLIEVHVQVQAGAVLALSPSSGGSNKHVFVGLKYPVIEHNFSRQLQR